MWGALFLLGAAVGEGGVSLTAASFAQAKASGKPHLIEFHSGMCGTCKECFTRGCSYWDTNATEAGTGDV